MRVLLADDHRLLLEGLQNLLTAHRIEVVGLAYDGNQAVRIGTRPEARCGPDGHPHARM